MMQLRLFTAMGRYLMFRFRQNPRLTLLLLAAGGAAFYWLKGWEVGG